MTVTNQGFEELGWAEAREMNYEELGAYWKLRHHQHVAGSIPSDPRQAADLVGMAYERMLALWAVLRRKFRPVQGRPDRLALAPRELSVEARCAADHEAQLDRSIELRPGESARDAGAGLSSLGAPDSAAQQHVVDAYREAALVVYGALIAARKRVRPRASAPAASYGTLWQIAVRLADGRTVDQCLRVIDVVAAQTEADPRLWQRFDWFSPFRAEAFEEALRQPPVDVRPRSARMGMRVLQGGRGR